MQIVVRRTGGIAGLTRAWRIDTDACADPDDWAALVDGLPRTPPARPQQMRDDFEWTITVASTTIRVPGSQLDGAWAVLVQRVRTEGEPT
ncbi:hypothetical protein ASG04_06760 [Curtobacterium sp. Leaf183]|uniref:protealysin inhibitor emfourin n=1 Tax=Curtobacterium sp. Leaf183 TaxID=1736291 RepID=UPI0006F58D5D|nr:protealysin inhibitor emfourin [Curtobacterium sp. Leaf183]KQS08664.1 hypothetical protein ASG04_06760 [Curtobacterium sp. Leaf183]